MADAQGIRILAGEKGGRPAGFSQAGAKRLENGEGTGEESKVTKLSVRKAEALVQKEEALAKQAELNYLKSSGEYLSRTAFREATATLLAEVAQALRSLPDLMERKCGLPPEAITLAEKTIDETLSDLAAGLELFTEQPPPA